jgi:plasmid stabilization system protein ParE
MKQFRLTVSRRADEDADAIFEWLSGRSPVGASRWFNAFRDTLRAISQKPEGYSRAPEAEMLDRDIRQALFKTRRGHIYRTMFVVIDADIHVIAVRGYGQELATPDDLDLPS